jgi:carboxymethylenebutenolidase
MAAAWENIKVDGSDMRAYVSAPAEFAKVPGIVVVQGQSGVDDFVEFSNMVAGRGYVAVAPDMFHRDGPDCKDDGPTRRGRLRDATVIQDIDAAVGFLKNNSRVDFGKIGIVGFCMGGRVVYLMASVNRDIKPGVMYYGSDPFSAWGDGPSPFARSKDIHCPIMGHFGANDKNPSPDDMRKLDA